MEGEGEYDGYDDGGYEDSGAPTTVRVITGVREGAEFVPHGNCGGDFPPPSRPLLPDGRCPLDPPAKEAART